jgi:glycosyltransferase involved in cell wall biosynthesis|tara:strand:- start:3528 stop:4601 length:1074 start_codon:yes stop_codon:yes gene_type:complete
MKISFMVNQYTRISGGNRALFEYANRLKEKGHEVRWFVLAKHYKWFRLDKKIRASRTGVKIVPPETIDWIDNTIPIEVLPINHPKYIPEADVIVATAWQTADFAAKLSVNKGVLFYFILHYESLWTRYKSRALKTYDLSCRKLVCSNWIKNNLVEKHGQNADVLVIPVDRDIFFCKEKKWNSTRRICLLHHDYEWKGYVEGIEAIKKVKQQGQEVELVVFGEKLEDPQPLFDAAGFSFEYHYRPAREQLRKIYTSCDIFLCASWYEGLGLTAMEAMACRCSLVTTDTGGCLEYAVNGQTALVSPPRDIDSLSQNLVRLLDDEILLKTLSENGCQKIAEFEWEKSCDQLISLFKEGQS